MSVKIKPNFLSRYSLVWMTGTNRKNNIFTGDFYLSCCEDFFLLYMKENHFQKGKFLILKHIDKDSLPACREHLFYRLFKSCAKELGYSHSEHSCMKATSGVNEQTG